MITIEQAEEKIKDLINVQAVKIVDAAFRVESAEYIRYAKDRLLTNTMRIIEAIEKPRPDTAKQARSIVRGIIADFTDRRGLRQEWEQIDDEIQAEIIIRWREIARQVLEGGE